MNSDIVQTLESSGFKKVNSGKWKSSDSRYEVFAYGRNPMTDWKIFRKVLPPGSVAIGSGPVELQRALAKLQ